MRGSSFNSSTVYETCCQNKQTDADSAAGSSAGSGPLGEIGQQTAVGTECMAADEAEGVSDLKDGRTHQGLGFVPAACREEQWACMGNPVYTCVKPSKNTTLRRWAYE